MKKSLFIKILIIASLLANVFFIYKIAKINQVDKIATENDLMVYMHHYEVAVLHIGEVLNDPDNKESFYFATSEAEFIKVFSTAPIPNYYGQKKKDLSRHIIELARQVSAVVLDYFVFEDVASLSLEETNKLKIVQQNFQKVVTEANKNKLAYNDGAITFTTYEKELIKLIKEATTKNETILINLTNQSDL